jgi:hypothetical protein
MAPLKRILQSKGDEYLEEIDEHARGCTQNSAPVYRKKCLTPKKLTEMNLEKFLPEAMEKIRPLKIQEGWVQSALCAFDELESGSFNRNGGRVSPNSEIERYMKRSETWPEFRYAASTVHGSSRPLSQRSVPELKRICKYNSLKYKGDKVELLTRIDNFIDEQNSHDHEVEEFTDTCEDQQVPSEQSEATAARALIYDMQEQTRNMAQYYSSSQTQGSTYENTVNGASDTSENQMPSEEADSSAAYESIETNLVKTKTRKQLQEICLDIGCAQHGKKDTIAKRIAETYQRQR